MFQLRDIDRFDEMFAKAGFPAAADVFVHAVAAHGDPLHSPPARGQLAHQFVLPGDQVLYAFFQATFSSGCVEKGSRGYSISRERRPDIVLVHSCSGFSRTLVLDAKWRSGRDNVLQAMESVHIYHDALRFDARRPEPCLILLPGPGAVASLEGAEFVQQHGVGALSQFAVGLGGEKMLGNLIWSWLKTAPLS